MVRTSVFRDGLVPILACGALLAGSLAAAKPPARPSADAQCQAQIEKILGDYLQCLLYVDADRLLGGWSPLAFWRSEAACDREYERRQQAVARQWRDRCPSLDDSPLGIGDHIAQLGSAVDDTRTLVGLLVSGQPPSPQPGSVIFFNNCKVPLKQWSNSNPSPIKGNLLQPGDFETIAIGQFNAQADNNILVAPVTTDDECQRLACQDWTDIQAAGQRMGSMWEAPNLTYAAYCQPTNAAAKQCLTTTDTPCCGRKLNMDGTYGTQLELTPFGSGGALDAINLSTNYGTGPSHPPPLAPCSNEDCVTENANIFFNVPIQVDMSGGDCSCDSLGLRHRLICTAVSCEDAYRHPTDPKQCQCSSGGQRGYVVTYCPDGAPLPPLPTAGP